MWDVVLPLYHYHYLWYSWWLLLSLFALSLPLWCFIIIPIIIIVIIFAFVGQNIRSGELGKIFQSLMFDFDKIFIPKSNLDLWNQFKQTFFIVKWTVLVNKSAVLTKLTRSKNYDHWSFSPEKTYRKVMKMFTIIILMVSLFLFRRVCAT